jgi:hypothetical protein
MLLQLEPRIFLYNLAGTEWADTNLTFSYMLDGTPTGDGQASTMFAHMESLGIPVETWQGAIESAMAEWAAHSPLTFTRVPDDGSPQGVSGLVQGDPRFGDIRIGAASYEVLAFAWYPSSTTRGGDVTFSDRYIFNIGTPYDLRSLAMHEIGHALGLKHSSDPTAVMSTTSTRVLTGLAEDDKKGIQAIYEWPSDEPDVPDEPPPPSPPPADEEPTKPGKGKGGGKGKLMDLFSRDNDLLTRQTL